MQSILSPRLQYLSERGDLHQIFFSKKALDDFEIAQKNTMMSDENGGIILGIIEENSLYVESITSACVKDERARYAFLRQDEKHLEAWSSINSDSKGRIGYLGEWHSHPEKNPTPSKIDQEEWTKIRGELGAPLLFIIIGAETMYLEGIFKEHV